MREYQRRRATSVEINVNISLTSERDQVIKHCFSWIPTGFASGLIFLASTCSFVDLNSADK